MKLAEALPFLVLGLESALAHLGRGKLAVQLREVVIERWAYDEEADVAHVHFRPLPEGAAPGEIVSLYDELGVNLETDGQGRLTGMEILGASAIVAQLEAISPPPP